jgi:yeast amino acid transporter
MEFWFSTLKVLTITFISMWLNDKSLQVKLTLHTVGSGIIIDLGAAGKCGRCSMLHRMSTNHEHRFYGVENWKEPFAESYMEIKGAKGHFLGFWAVLMQAGFSFFGSEVPGIAAG